MERSLYCFEYITRKRADVLKELEAQPPSVLQAATDTAVATTHEFKSRLHVDLAGFDVGRDVKIELGKPNERGYAVYIPIKWHAASQSGLFPSMDAELEIASLSDAPPLTQISLIGRYRPPIGVFGALGDAMLGHRVAEAASRNFITDLAKRLQHG